MQRYPKYNATPLHVFSSPFHFVAVSKFFEYFDIYNLKHSYTSSRLNKDICAYSDTSLSFVQWIRLINFETENEERKKKRCDQPQIICK